MKLFGRPGSGATSSDGRGSAGGNGHAPPAHRFTLNLARAEGLATMVAKSRAARAVEISDMLAGMYICDWERVAQYWPENHQDEIEEFLQRICQMSPQRWHSWIEFYDASRRDEERRARIWQPLRGLLKQRAGGEPLAHSDSLAAVLRQAGQITPFYDRTRERSIPILTSEAVLLCIARGYGSEIAKKLAETGLDTAKLERDVFLPRRAPLS